MLLLLVEVVVAAAHELRQGVLPVGVASYKKADGGGGGEVTVVHVRFPPPQVFLCCCDLPYSFLRKNITALAVALSTERPPRF